MSNELRYRNSVLF